MGFMMRLISLLLVLSIVVPGTVVASHDDVDFSATLAELEANRRAIVAENMILPAEKAAAFWAVYDDYRGEMGELEKQGLRMLREFHEHFEEITNERANQIMAAYFSRETKILKVREKYVPRFNKALSARQTLRLYQIESKLESIIQSDVSSVTPLVPD